MAIVAGREVPTPELDKQHVLNEPAQPFDVLSSFYDWLCAEGLVIATYGRQKERTVSCPECRGRRFKFEGLSPRELQLLRTGNLPDEERDPCDRCEGSGSTWISVVDEDSLQEVDYWDHPEVLFARYWGLDLDKIRNEREELLSALQEQASQKCKVSPQPTTNEEEHMTDETIEDVREETRVIVPPRGAQSEEIVIGPIALDDCDALGSQIRHRWPNGDGEGQYAEGIHPEHLDGVRAALEALALKFWIDGWATAIGSAPHRDKINIAKDAISAKLEAGVEPAPIDEVQQEGMAQAEAQADQDQEVADDGLADQDQDQADQDPEPADGDLPGDAEAPETETPEAEPGTDTEPGA